MFQLCTVEVNSPNVCIAVISPTEDTTWINIWSTQIGNSSQITLAAVAIVSLVALATAIVPIEGARGFAQLCLGVTVGIIGNGMNGSTSQSVEYRQVFLSAIDAPTTDTPVLGVVSRLDIVDLRCPSNQEPSCTSSLPCRRRRSRRP